jgi:hypothetical protein
MMSPRPRRHGGASRPGVRAFVARRWRGVCVRMGLLMVVSMLSDAVFANDQGSIYYVRGDGGDAGQCDGRSDAALAKGRRCAWKHPFIALPPGGSPRIKGGDTLFIRGGDFRMGYGAPETQGCSKDYPWDCHMAAVPSGPLPTRPTRISGVDGNGLCSARPELWGAERAFNVLNLDGSNNVRVECLEITDRASCVERHCHGGECKEVAACNRDSFPFGDWAGNGVYARDSSNVELIDLDVHGLALNGFRVGRLRDWTLRGVRIVGNGWAGWDGNLGGSTDSSNDGTIRFQNVQIAWNGCVERYPERTPFGCWAQKTGGYGDGLGTGETGGHWIFEDVHVHHNTSDGIDLLYVKPPGRVTATRVRAHANAGNQFKTSGEVRLTDSVIDGTCNAFKGVGNMKDGDMCRALGNAVSLGAPPDSRIVLSGNRILGAGDCLVVVEGGDASARVELRDNEFIARPRWSEPRRLVCGFYAHKSKADVSFVGNGFFGVRGRQCPPGSRCGAAPE